MDTTWYDREKKHTCLMGNHGQSRWIMVHNFELHVYTHISYIIYICRYHTHTYIYIHHIYIYIYIHIQMIYTYVCVAYVPIIHILKKIHQNSGIVKTTSAKTSIGGCWSACCLVTGVLKKRHGLRTTKSSACQRGGVL